MLTVISTLQPYSGSVSQYNRRQGKKLKVHVLERKSGKLSLITCIWLSTVKFKIINDN